MRTMSLTDIEALKAAPMRTEPYDYVVVPGFVGPEALGRIAADFPTIAAPGSFPPSELRIEGAFAELLAEMDGPAFREAVEAKFGLDLSGRPTMFTVRGQCRPNNGKVHTDSETKVISVLLYLNQSWEADGGRLRLLRSPDLNDVAEEVPPTGGALLVFRRGERSWHGHEPFDGPRRVVQMNWVTDAGVVRREQGRHRLSAFFKRLPFARRGGEAY
jgi:SM-20-related protein